MSTGALILIVMAAGLGAMVHGSVGIGLALVAGPALLMIDSGFAPGPLLVAGQIVGLRHAIVERAETGRQACAKCLRGLPIGLALGLLVLTMMSDETLALVVGGLTMAAAAALLAGLKVTRTPTVEIIGGAATAFSSITAGMPGPPFVITFNDMKPGALRGTSSSYVLMVAIVGFLSLLITGNFGRHEAELTLWLLPGVLLGLFASRWVRPLVDRDWFRPLVLIIAFIGGAALVARQLV